MENIIKKSGGTCKQVVILLLKFECGVNMMLLGVGFIGGGMDTGI